MLAKDDDLHRAIEAGDLCVVEREIKNGRRICRGCSSELREDGLYQPAIHLAIEYGHMNIVEYLVTVFGDSILWDHDADLITPLIFAASRKCRLVFDALVRLSPQLILEWNCAYQFRHAASAGKVRAVETLSCFMSNIDVPEYSGWTAMHCAAYRGHISVIKSLVRLGSRALDMPTDCGETPLYLAAGEGHSETVETLVRLGSRALDFICDDSSTALSRAADRGFSHTVETLVRLGSKHLDLPGKFDWTPVQTARLGGEVECVKSLLALGATVLEAERPRIEKLLKKPIDEETVMEVRYRVYFQGSLVYRLLFELDVQENQAASQVRRRCPNDGDGL